jgi:Protein of unknown function DUF262/Protein of unknown function (DUF1524)
MKQPKDVIGFEHKGIGAVLSQNRLIVPLNQREYSWEEKNIRELFQDFANAIDNNNIYFLGTIVLTRGESDYPEVSDGQQRLATTSVLLAAIRDYFFKTNDKVRSNHIETTFLRTTDLETTQAVPKLRLNVDDNEFFTKYVIASPHETSRKIKPSKESHEKIKLACTLAAQHVKDILAAYNQENLKVNRLLEWIKFIENSAQVILLRVPDHLNAFMMFETLNDRGLRASQADLLKNHLLSQCGDRIKEGQQKWAQMLGVLETIGKDDITISYLQALLITKYGQTPPREVFLKVKDKMNSNSRALEFLYELADGANDYAALYSSDNKKWNDYSSSTRKHISTINRDLRIDQIRPLMFSVSRHFTKEEGIIAFKLFVFWSVRLLIVGTRGGGLYDKTYSNAAQLIASKKISTAKELTQHLINIIPSDTDFENSFSEARISYSYFARYLLRALEMKKKGETEPEFVPMDDEQIINLEHILPENPDSNWKGIDNETLLAYYKRLGNMVIMQAKKNTLIGNSKFEDKKKIFKKSAYLLTNEVAEYQNWGAKEIVHRQKNLAKLATQIWTINP